MTEPVVDGPPGSDDTVLERGGEGQAAPRLARRS